MVFLDCGLSLVNTVLLVAQSNWSFLGGLGITVLAAGIAVQVGGTIAQVIGFGINLWAAGLFVFLGFNARKGLKWAFITGMIFYAVDALLVLWIQAWLMLAFHGYIFYRLYEGFSSCNDLHAFDRKPAVAYPPAPPPL